MPIARRARGGLFCAAAAAATLSAASVFAGGAGAAEPSAADKDTSRGLYREGMRLLDGRDFAGAERACRGAHALVQAPTSASCWARALESLGRLIEARDAFLEAARYPTAPGEPPVFTSARDAARAEADALGARIPTMVLVVSGVAESTSLTASVDGATLAPDTVRLPRKVDPGRHVVVVAAAGARAVHVEVNAPEGRTVQVPVELASSGDASPAPAAALAPVDAPSSTTSTPSRLPMYAAFGAGGAGLVIGVVAGLAAGAKDSSIAAECNGKVCPSSARGDIDSFHSLSTVSTAAYVVGVAGVAAGAAFWFFGPHASVNGANGASGASARVWVGPGSGGVAGTF